MTVRRLPLTTDDVIEALGGWEGYSVEKIEVHKEGETTQVWIELSPLPGIERRCSGCGRKVRQVHDVTPRWVRDVAILEAETWLWLGRVRVDEANRLRHDKPARKVVKDAKWLLLRNRENVPRRDRVKLKELLQANRQLMTIYVLKDDLKHLWDYTPEGAARRFWESWYNRAVFAASSP